MTGNLIDALANGEVGFAVQGCNCFVRMKRGLAAEVRQRIPAAVQADRRTLMGGFSKLGTYTSVEWPAGTGRRFVNGYIQAHWGRRLNREPVNEDGTPLICDYSAVRKLLRSLHKDFRRDWVLGMPLLGCGLAGGDWERLAAIVDEELIQRGRAVNVYVLDPSHLPEAYRHLAAP